MKNFGNCLSCRSFANSVFSCIGRINSASELNGKSISLTLKKRQELYKEGTSMKGVFCVQKGKVKIYKSCHNRNLIVELTGDSDFLGYGALFNGDRYTNSAKCLEDTTVCFIPKDVFKDLLEKKNDLLMMLLRRANKENQHLSNIITNLKCTNMLGRISNAIIEVSAKYGHDENTGLKVELTRKDLSELSGTTTESVIRILNDLKKEKVIDLKNSRIRILNQGKLKEYRSQK